MNEAAAHQKLLRRIDKQNERIKELEMLTNKNILLALVIVLLVVAGVSFFAGYQTGKLNKVITNTTAHEIKIDSAFAALPNDSAAIRADERAKSKGF